MIYVKNMMYNKYYHIKQQIDIVYVIVIFVIICFINYRLYYPVETVH